MDQEHLNDWTKAALHWAELDGRARELEELRKTVFSEIVNRSNAKSVAKAEHEAFASHEYRVHVKKMVQARTEANVAKAHVDGLKIQFEKWRTMQATRRTEMGLT